MLSLIGVRYVKDKTKNKGKAAQKNKVPLSNKTDWCLYVFILIKSCYSIEEIIINDQTPPNPHCRHLGANACLDTVYRAAFSQ